jgi:hypothetical protein
VQKPPGPRGRTAFACCGYYCFFSVLLEAAAPDPEVEPLAALLSCFGASDEVDALDEDDGALLEPPAALSFFSVEDAALDEEGLLGVVALDEELSFFFDASIDTELEVEPEPDGAAAEPEGAAGEVVELDEEEPAEPEGVVVLETARSPSRSQPVSMPAPSARETATAKVVSFISAMSSVGWGTG